MRTAVSARRFVVILCGMAILTLIYCALFFPFPRSSDEANFFLAGLDMSHGNWRLHGWQLSPDNFATIDIPIYAALTALFGPTPILMYVLPILSWAVAAVLTIRLAMTAEPVGGSIIGAIGAASLVLFPLLTNNDPMPMVARAPVHVSTIVAILVCVDVLHRAVLGSVRPGRALAGVFVVLLVAVIGDPMAIIIGTLPMVCVSALYVLRGRRPGLHIAISGTALLATVLARELLRLIVWLGGFRAQPLPPLTFVAFDKLGAQLVLAVKSLLILTGTDFFGRTLSGPILSGSPVFLIRLPLVLLLAAVLVKIGLNAYRGLRGTRPLSGTDYLDLLLWAAFVFDVAATSLSTMVADIFSARIFLPALFFGAVLLGRAAGNRVRAGAYFGVCLLASLLFTLATIVHGPVRLRVMDPQIASVARWLRDRALLQGFGAYWTSSIITAGTRETVKVRALAADPDHRLTPRLWLANTGWYALPMTADNGTADNGRTFVIVDTSGYFTQDDVIHSFGAPEEVHRVGGDIIDVYPASAITRWP